MSGKKTLEEAQKAIEDAHFEVFNTDETNAQLSLSACLNSDSGRWFLAAVQGAGHR